MAIPLFTHYPSLAEKLPYSSLGKFPTPLTRLDNIGNALGINSLYIKQDSMSGPYGGNKVRKLEFILGDALQRDAEDVMTFGFAGSNHAAATAFYARSLGLDCTSILVKQQNAHYVRDNLLVACNSKAKLYHFNSILSAIVGSMCVRADYRVKRRKPIFTIPPGGSSLIGTIGYVNAAFELAGQIEAGTKKPDAIYVALGSMGTAAGLILGLKAAGIETKVIAVDVVGKRFANAKGLKRMIDAAGRFLHSLDSTFPLIDVSLDEIYVRHEFLGQGYAHFAQGGMFAVNLMRKTEGIKLDGTYTGKALSAIISDVPSLVNNKVLFWNTYNSMSLSGIISKEDYHCLPKQFHRYFESEVQPLDFS